MASPGLSQIDTAIHYLECPATGLLSAATNGAVLRRNTQTLNNWIELE